MDESPNAQLPVVFGARWAGMSETPAPPDERDKPAPPPDDRSDWGDRVRDWAAKLGDWLDALLPAPQPAPVPIPIPVRNRRRP